jgi:putative GTP pyrophosphokinase
MTSEQLASAVTAYEEKKNEFQIFMDGVSQWFQTHPRLRQQDFPIVHSVKSRLKSCDHLTNKIPRKEGDSPISRENVFQRITDLAGVRVFHLYQDQFRSIHKEILVKIEDQRDWYLHEPPKAYTWDPESKQFFEGLNVQVEIKDSFYTSVHYVVRPRADSPICCEIQVRTLFEEVWGEVDHALNYPEQSSVLSCREQLLVLAKLVGAGTRLVDSIFRSLEEEERQELTIHSAVYGADGHPWKDVASKLSTKIEDGRLRVPVTNEEFGPDPLPNVEKQLEVTYSHGGQTYHKRVRENETLSIPES